MFAKFPVSDLAAPEDTPESMTSHGQQAKTAWASWIFVQNPCSRSQKPEDFQIYALIPARFNPVLFQPGRQPKSP